MILKFWHRWPPKQPLNLSILKPSPDRILKGMPVTAEKELGEYFQQLHFWNQWVPLSKCTVECDICLTLILKSAQARCAVHLISSQEQLAYCPNIYCLHVLAAPELFSGNNGDCGIDTLGVLGSISLQQNLSSPVFKSHPHRVGGPLVLLKSRKK